MSIGRNLNSIFWLLLISSQGYAQTINFSGKLLNQKTEKPIAYANISFLNKMIGVSSREDGSFSLEIDKNLLNEKVHISCLNYRDTIVLGSVIQNTTLYLSPSVLELDEVFLKKNTKQIIVDKIKRINIKDGFSGSRKFPWIVTKFFSKNEAYFSTPFIKNVSIYYAKFENNKAKYRLRFYQNDNGKPGKDLISKSIIILKNEKDKSNDIDVYSENIQIPKEGLFIGLERINIPYNFQEIEYKDPVTKLKVVKTSVSPNFGGIRNKNSGTWFFQNGIWQNLKLAKHKDNSSLVPAISLTLSN